MITEIKTQVMVLGSGPSGYSAAFRCADLGLQTLLVERFSVIGGVCLNVGCIPSKTLLHIAKMINDIETINNYGIYLNKPKIDLSKIREFKNEVIKKLTKNLSLMAKLRKIQIVNGQGKFISPSKLEVHSSIDNVIHISYDNAIIAGGSRSLSFPLAPQNDLIWNSTNALELTMIPKRLLIIGGGIIGLEIATIYHALGTKIDIVEIFDQLIPVADKDIINIFSKHIINKFNLMLETNITKIEPIDNRFRVSFKHKDLAEQHNLYDAILVCIGRKPNSDLLNIEKTGVKINENGFILVDNQMRTNISNIFAIGDIVGTPMLAHKGIYEGHLAAEVISGKKHFFDSKIIPSIVYTDPEVGWVGLTEKEAISQNIPYKVSTFPWEASGRAIASNCQHGITKLIFDKNTNRILGGSIVGTNGGELLGEIGLAIEMGCYAEDLSLTIHAHPTLYETIGLAAKVYEGTITDLLNKNKIF